MDTAALLKLWNLEDIPACDVGMELARTYLVSCGQGVNRLGTEEPGDRITDITAAYNDMVEHVGVCPKCQEV